jgi:hypothetical protein
VSLKEAWSGFKRWITSRRTLDFVERVGTTVALGVVSWLVIEATQIPGVYGVLILGVLNGIKVQLARQVGNPDSGGFVDTDPVPPPIPDPVWDAAVDSTVVDEVPPADQAQDD